MSTPCEMGQPKRRMYSCALLYYSWARYSLHCTFAEAAVMLSGALRMRQKTLCMC